jgi:hypothetical protein
MYEEVKKTKIRSKKYKEDNLEKKEREIEKRRREEEESAEPTKQEQGEGIIAVGVHQMWN